MSEPVVVDLPSHLTIATAEALHEQLEPLVNGSEDVTLNASSVERADTAGLQTLLAFARALEARSAVMSWLAPSRALVDAAEQLGLKQFLSLT